MNEWIVGNRVKTRDADVSTHKYITENEKTPDRAVRKLKQKAQRVKARATRGLLRGGGGVFAGLEHAQ